MKRNIAIIEDDAFIAQDLQEILIENGYEPVWIAHSVAEAMSFLKKNKAELILMDIHLDDVLDGIHLAGIVKNEYSVPVVFTTAFSDPPTLERVKNVSPYGYVVKPYTSADIRVAIEMAFSRSDTTKNSSDNSSDSVFVNSVSGMVRIEKSSILFLEAYDYYANIYTSKEKTLAKMTLGELLETIGDDALLRVHKSYAVNLKHIGKIKSNEIYMGEFRVPVGRTFKEELKKRIKII